MVHSIEAPAVSGQDSRKQRGIAIAAYANIREDRFGYKVPAQSRSGSYLVNLEYGAYCTCPDFEERQLPCKHVFAVEIILQRKEQPDGSTLKSRGVQVVADRAWPAYAAAQQNEGRHFGQLLRALCDGIPEPPREPEASGRPPVPHRGRW